MQQFMNQTGKPKRDAKKLILSLLLSAVLGLGGYFGGLALFTGQNPFTTLLGGAPAPAGIPTDEYGNNLIGNTMENLHSGGLITQQGEDYFFANFDDGGKLYCQDRNGIWTRLTDFAVANLNVRGDVLLFTDLSSCSYMDTSGRTHHVSALQHYDIWNAAGTTQGVSYGGGLYTLTGVRSFCEGNVTVDELVLTQAEYDGTIYRSPIFTENHLVLLAVSSQDNLIIFNENNETIEIKVTQNENENIVNFIVIGENAFVQVINEQTRTGYIARYDLYSGERKDTAYGHSLTVWMGCPVFISEDDGLIYLWDLDIDDFILISRVRPVGNLLSGFAEGIGDVNHGPAFHTQLQTGGYKLIFLVAVSGADAKLKPRGGYALADPDGITVDSLKVTVFSVTASASYKAFDEDEDSYTPQPSQAWPQKVKPGKKEEDPDGGKKVPEKKKKPLKPMIEDALTDKGPRPDTSNPEKEKSREPEEKGGGNNTPQGAFAALILMLQDEDYSNSAMQKIYTKSQYEKAISYYTSNDAAEDLLFNNLMNIKSEFADQLASDPNYAGTNPESQKAFVTGIADAINGWFNLFEYTVDNVDLHSDDSATVHITVTQHVDFTFDLFEAYIYQEILNYPGGMGALRSLGESGFLNWVTALIVDFMSNPESNDMLATSSAKRSAQLIKVSGVWVVDNDGENDFADLLFRMY